MTPLTLLSQPARNNLSTQEQMTNLVSTSRLFHSSALLHSDTTNELQTMQKKLAAPPKGKTDAKEMLAPTESSTRAAKSLRVSEQKTKLVPSMTAVPDSRGIPTLKGRHECEPGMIIFSPPTVSSTVHRDNESSVQLTYGPWRILHPHFVRSSHLKWWLQYKVVTWRRQSGCPEADGYVSFCEAAYTTGKVETVQDVVVALGQHDCGQSGSVHALRSAGAKNKNITHHVDVLFWAVIPATWTFQHWCAQIIESCSV
jgi:hypothetical protein